ncbi:MAG: lysophospholipid acyltransferase family protein [Myxococcota bacterium]
MRTLNSAIRLIFGFLWMAFASTVFMVLATLLMPFRVTRVKLCNWYGHIAGRSITWFAGVTPKVKHHERLQGSNPAIFVMNHTSTLDAFLGIWLCPIGACGVFKKEIVRVPFFGQLAWLSGHLLLDRFNKDKAVETLKDAADFVKKNRLGIWIMPEGTRSKDGRLLPFKKGFVHLAIATGFPVVPVIIHGAHKNWVKGTFFSFTPMDLDIEVLEPIDTSTWKEETAGAHADAVRAIFAERLPADMQPAAVPPAPATPPPATAPEVPHDAAPHAP